MNWNLIGFIKASEYRQKILLELNKGYKTPKELKIKTGYYMSHISHTLKELSEKGIVVCLTPELYRGKIYSLTELGKTIISQLNAE